MGMQERVRAWECKGKGRVVGGGRIPVHKSMMDGKGSKFQMASRTAGLDATFSLFQKLTPFSTCASRTPSAMVGYHATKRVPSKQVPPE